MKISELLAEGEYQTIQQIQAKPGSYSATWVPRISALQARADAVADRIIKSGLYKGLPPRIDVGLQDSYANTSPMFGGGGHRPILRIDVTVFWDAPDETLTFVVAHEIGHVHLGHDPSKDKTPNQNKNQELEADRFAAQVMKQFGYSQARVFNFMHSKREQYNKQEAWNRRADSSHPTYDQRIRQAGELGLRISHGGAGQLDHLMA